MSNFDVEAAKKAWQRAVRLGPKADVAALVGLLPGAIGEIERLRKALRAISDKACMASIITARNVAATALKEDAAREGG